MIDQIPKIVRNDAWLKPYTEIIRNRYERALNKEKELMANSGTLTGFATGYLYFGLIFTGTNWILREWAPNAAGIYLIGEFNNWQENEDYRFTKKQFGQWEIVLPAEALVHKQLYKLLIYWEGGQGYRLPSYTKRVVQHETTKVFDAQVWQPGESYIWKNQNPEITDFHPLIYEAHVGMATEEESIGTFNEFTEKILPRISGLGYNTIQLMAVQEHPYYGSFGYHVSNFFAVSSRFGTPEDLKNLVDTAHGMGLKVIMDLVHSHSVKNELEGLGRFDGTPDLYFHPGNRREHIAWDSLCFDYGKNEVLHFLLSNCKFWLDEYRFDGFRFDGVTSMLYYDHGLSKNFTNYEMYYDGNQDEDAISYFILANKLIHETSPYAITVAEEMSGMPGLAEPIESGGYGFDYRLAMGIPDYWIKIIKEVPDENWNISELYYELTSKRKDEKTIAYAESHDQALVGDKTIIFRLMDKEMYWSMNKQSQNLIVDRGMALHKMIRLVTIATSGGGYLNFMGNEFGHPEWIDFPREGNNWSYKYARRQWSLADNKDLKYHFLADFDKAMIELVKNNKILGQNHCRLITDNRGDQILAFERQGLVFVFNFNPVKSFTDYGINVGAGKFKILLNTDSHQYGGFGRIDETITYYAFKSGKLSSPEYLKLYLPSRTAFVLRKLPSRSVYDL
ncbi:MAG: alpha amylase C-terminal domain-containing protein [Bacteroidales bacterium]|nr:alpha amylase C-terminal domain-containing protein [Bacteroidales bacterium]